METEPQADLKHSMRKLLPYLQLCRLPAVFSAMADITLGYLLTQSPSSVEFGATFVSLLIASSALYLAGMVLNDVFDVRIDTVERPSRPIPSGRVSYQFAVILGIVLLVIGNLAAIAAGVTSLAVAGILTLCILSYDGLLKQTPLGPIAMGGCRFLNIMLGASSSGAFLEIWTVPQIHVALGMGVYIAGLTWFARDEAGQSRRGLLAAAMGLINLGFALLIAFVMHWPPGPHDQTALLVVGVIAITINRRLANALFDPVPAKVQVAVRTMLLSIVSLDAALVLHATGSPVYTFGVIALLIPAHLLGRWMAIT